MANNVTKSIATGLGLIASQGSADGTYNGYEAPPYTVEQTIDTAEIRLYAPHLIAEVTVQGDADRARSKGFSILAGYIFGGNTSQASINMTTPVTQRPSEKIAMTTPVTQSGDGDTWTVSFTMPRAYTLDTLPTPKTDAIQFKMTEPDRQIVLRFSGIARTGDMNAKAADLRILAQSSGITLGEWPFYYFYDAPMTLPWKRRNEVAYAVN